MIYGDGIPARYQYRGEKVGSVTQILSQAGLTGDLSQFDPEMIRKKGELGTLIHSYAAATLLEQTQKKKKLYDSMDERAHSYRESFDEWFERCVLDFEAIIVEKKLYYRSIFAGTPDFAGLMTIKGEGASWDVWDWKCRPFHFADSFQTRAYKELAKHNDKKGYLEKLKNRWVLELRPNAVAKPHLCQNDEEDWRIFLAALTLFQVRLAKGTIKWR